jgi:hypothetical protein
MFQPPESHSCAFLTSLLSACGGSPNIGSRTLPTDIANALRKLQLTDDNMLYLKPEYRTHQHLQYVQARGELMAAAFRSLSISQMVLTQVGYSKCPVAMLVGLEDDANSILHTLSTVFDVTFDADARAPLVQNLIAYALLPLTPKETCVAIRFLENVNAAVEATFDRKATPDQTALMERYFPEDVETAASSKFHIRWTRIAVCLRFLWDEQLLPQQGWMRVEASFLCVKSWKMRWFVLSNTSLQFYEDDSLSKLKGEIQLVNISDVVTSTTHSTLPAIAEQSPVYTICTPCCKCTVVAFDDNWTEKIRWSTWVLDA